MILRGTVFSNVLGMDTGITIVTPNDYSIGKRYKVAYLLHGLFGNNETWLNHSSLATYATNGKTIYIMPEVARSFYTDMKHGFKYFTYITEELPKTCESIFNISAERENTAIIGASMGGYGALKCALTYPEKYGMCGAFSSGCLFLKEGLDYQRDKNNKQELVNMYGEQLLDDFKSIFGDDLEWKAEYEITELLLNDNVDMNRPLVYTTCGTEDNFRNDHIRLNEEVCNSKVEYCYEEWFGYHDYTFFNESLKKAIEKFDL